MKQLLSTKEIAQFLGVNEKMVYTLISEKGLPATKITGKWLFPTHLVDSWIENNTLNHPVRNEETSTQTLVIAGSNDILLEQVITHFNTSQTSFLVATSNIGSTNGLLALKNNLCHMVTAHLQEGKSVPEEILPNERLLGEQRPSGQQKLASKEYNFSHASQALPYSPVIVNFCTRQQGIIVAKDNPHNITSIKDIVTKQLTLVNRNTGSGTRQLLDTELASLKITPTSIKGYNQEVTRHLDIGLVILAGNAHAGLGIESVAKLLDLDFIPLQLERFDFIIAQEQFFKRHVQAFLNYLKQPSFLQLAQSFSGYFFHNTGEILFPPEKTT